MRPVERDILLLILAVGSGSADGWSFVGLGHCFVANMTGNTVFCGMAIFGHSDLTGPLIALGSYIPGVLLASFLTRRVPKGVLWHRAISFTLLIEAAGMAAAEARWIFLQLHGALHQSPAHNPLVHPLLATVAFGLGMQSGAMLRLQVPGIVTTYISGTWTTMASNLVKLRTREAHRPARERIQFEERLVLQMALLAAYFLSAVLTGWLLSRDPIAAGATPPLAVLCAGIYGLVRA